MAPVAAKEQPPFARLVATTETTERCLVDGVRRRGRCRAARGGLYELGAAALVTVW